MTARTPRAPEPDYTHALHAQACQEAAQRGEVLAGAYVLAKRGLIVYCARIHHPWTIPGGPDCWTLYTLWPEQTRLTIPCRNVIECPADRCSCRPVGAAAAVGRACDSPLAAGAAPAPEFGLGEVTCL